MDIKNKIDDFQQALNRLEGFIDELPHHEYTKQFLLTQPNVFITKDNEYLFNNTDANEVFNAIETIRTALKKLQPKE
tara:strand:- start:231 stop:461 length:231 start_codon:yes stop_codon:yes gene_type:complete